MKHLGIVIIFVVLGVILAFFTVPGLTNPLAKLTVPTVAPLTSTPQPTTTPKAISAPKRIIIPKLNVDTIIESVGKDNIGNMDIPKDYNNVAWYNLGPKPGEQGNAVMAGHVDTPQGNLAVFGKLDALQQGDTITIETSNGQKYTFTVTRGVDYELSKMPLEEIFSSSGDEKMLNLITCSGTWDTDRKMYTNRYVVYSRLVE